MPISLPQALGDGLILRRSTAADVEALADFNSRMHSEDGPDQPDLRIGAWTRDLLRRPHPTFGEGDFTIVEDTAKKQIVSTCNLISQTWLYEGLPFGVGRPELVGTLPNYRKRGLVRAQFQVLHQLSAERGEVAQAITGIPNFYRQYGYEMGLELGGGRLGYAAQVPALKADEPEPYHLRPVTEADLPLLQRLYAEAQTRYALTCPRDEAQWRYDLWGQSADNVNRREVRMITTAAGDVVGYLAHPRYLWNKFLVALQYELRPGLSWLAVTPSVVRYLWATGQAYAQRANSECVAFGLWFGKEHPAYLAWRDRAPHVRPPYAWYVRVPDLPVFLRRIAPALEKRLARSVAAGHTGRLKVALYHTGVRLQFEAGRLVSLGAYRPQPHDDSHAAFPELSFLHVLFGHKAPEELHQFYADCWFKDEEARALLAALFPTRPAAVWPIA
jgi:hypothetical protein